MAGILAAALALALCVSGALAAGPGLGRNFVDTDGDGVCDRCTAGTACGQDGHGCGFRGGRGR